MGSLTDISINWRSALMFALCFAMLITALMLFVLLMFSNGFLSKSTKSALKPASILPALVPIQIEGAKVAACNTCELVNPMSFSASSSLCNEKPAIMPQAPSASVPAVMVTSCRTKA